MIRLARNAVRIRLKGTSTSAVAVVVFAFLTAAVVFGMTLSGRLADHHLSSESIDTVKLALGLVATLAALLLGLLVSSIKESFDAELEQVNALAAKIATLDRVLALYGVDRAGARAELRAVIETAIAQAWPASECANSNLSVSPQRGEAIFRSIRLLQPTDAAQSDLKQGRPRRRADRGTLDERRVGDRREGR